MGARVRVFPTWFEWDQIHNYSRYQMERNLSLFYIDRGARLTLHISVYCSKVYLRHKYKFKNRQILPVYKYWLIVKVPVNTNTSRIWIPIQWVLLFISIVRRQFCTLSMMQQNWSLHFMGYLKFNLENRKCV